MIERLLTGVRSRTSISRSLLALLFLGFFALPCASGRAADAEPTGLKKRRPLPDEFGRVVMNNLSEKGKVAPVVFDHWVHRTRFTCRICHVDIGFAMQANGTMVREEDNRKGYFCGTCHDGKTAFGPRSKQPYGADDPSCDRCHSQGKAVTRELEFGKATAGLPKGRFGNGIDWEQAEAQGKIRLTDTLPGVSVKRKPLEIPKDYDIEAKVATFPEIVFSHKKHTVWNGCELCHPEIFSVKRGGSKLAMEAIFAGRYCGLCHGAVAFPTLDCQRCHTKTVAK